MCLAASLELLEVAAVALNDVDKDGQGDKSVSVIINTERGVGMV